MSLKQNQQPQLQNQQTPMQIINARWAQRGTCRNRTPEKT